MLKKIAKWTSNALLVIVIICTLSFILTGVITKKPSFFGFRPLIVMTDSMVPTLPVYSIQIGRPVDADDVRVGDIVMYKYCGCSFTHRVIEITEDGFILKGDNSEKPDPLVKPDQIKYRIMYSD